MEVEFDDWSPELKQKFAEWDKNATDMKAPAVKGARALALALASGNHVMVSGDAGMGNSQTIA